MKQSPSLGQVGSILAKFINQYHVVIYSLTIVIGVSVAIFFLNDLINLSNEAEPSPINAKRIDQETIDKIEIFHKQGSNNSDIPLPGGRTNPFVE